MTILHESCVIGRLTVELIQPTQLSVAIVQTNKPSCQFFDSQLTRNGATTQLCVQKLLINILTYSHIIHPS